MHLYGRPVGSRETYLVPFVSLRVYSTREYKALGITIGDCGIVPGEIQRVSEETVILVAVVCTIVVIMHCFKTTMYKLFTDCRL